jgi:hypothetical protein
MSCELNTAQHIVVKKKLRQGSQEKNKQTRAVHITNLKSMSKCMHALVADIVETEVKFHKVGIGRQPIRQHDQIVTAANVKINHATDI